MLIVVPRYDQEKNNNSGHWTGRIHIIIIYYFQVPTDHRFIHPKLVCHASPVRRLPYLYGIFLPINDELWNSTYYIARIGYDSLISLRPHVYPYTIHEWYNRIEASVSLKDILQSPKRLLPGHLLRTVTPGTRTHTNYYINTVLYIITNEDKMNACDNSHHITSRSSFKLRQHPHQNEMLDTKV